MSKRLTYQSLGVVVISSLFMLAYVIKPLFVERIALGIEDEKYALRTTLGLSPEPLDEVVLVEIDEPSINQYGRWPWDRGQFSELLAKMDQASVVVLDIVFSEISDKANDNKLTEQIEAQGNVILGFFMRQFASEHQSDVLMDTVEDCSYADVEVMASIIGVREYPYIESNIIEFSEAALTCAVFSTEPDSDGIYRHYPLGYLFKHSLYPPLAIQAIRYSKNTEAKIELDSAGFSQFEFYGNDINGRNYLRLNYYDTIRSVSAADLLSNNSKIDFKDKIVILGLTDLGIYDMRPTPLDPVTPGVYLHYTAANNLLMNNGLLEDVWIDVVMFCLLIIIAVVISRSTNMTGKLALYLSILIGLWLASNVLFMAFDIWIRESYGYFLFFFLVVYLESENFLYTVKYASKMKGAFSSYVSPALVKRITEDPSLLKLGGIEKEITVIFADLRGFTKLSEGLEPTQLVSLLNEIFEPLTNAVIEHEGMLDKYMGDALMAIFNAPLDIDCHQESAFLAVLDMQKNISYLNKTRIENNLAPVKLGIGVNTGVAVVGNMGSSIRFSYTALGDAVNVASRIEMLTKFYGCEFLLGGEVFDALCNESKKSLRLIDHIKVLGRNQLTRLYTENVNLSQVQLNQYELAFSEYVNGDFKQASEIWLSMKDQDPCAVTMAARCQVLIDNPPEDWQGCYGFDHK
jgi:adenylate cyclase